jgi:predicted nucleotidyltransferase
MQDPSTAADWQVTPEKVNAAVVRLVSLANPVKVFLFGSFVSGGLNRDSDLDVLLVTDSAIPSPRSESVRLRHALRDIHMPMDILVVPEEQFAAHANTPGLIYLPGRLRARAPGL